MGDQAQVGINRPTGASKPLGPGGNRRQRRATEAKMRQAKRIVKAEVAKVSAKADQIGQPRAYPSAGTGTAEPPPEFWDHVEEAGRRLTNAAPAPAQA